MVEDVKPVIWIGSSYNDWKAFPDDVQDVLGYSLHLAQQGETAQNVKPLKGFKGASVLEIVDRFDSDTYRAIHTVSFREAVYVLHAFQKKSTRGITTRKIDVDLAKQRLKLAEAIHATYQEQ